MMLALVLSIISSEASDLTATVSSASGIVSVVSLDSGTPSKVIARSKCPADGIPIAIEMLSPEFIYVLSAGDKQNFLYRFEFAYPSELRMISRREVSPTMVTLLNVENYLYLGTETCQFTRFDRLTENEPTHKQKSIDRGGYLDILDSDKDSVIGSYYWNFGETSNLDIYTFNFRTGEHKKVLSRENLEQPVFVIGNISRQELVLFDETKDVVVVNLLSGTSKTIPFPNNALRGFMAGSGRILWLDTAGTIHLSQLNSGEIISDLQTPNKFADINFLNRASRKDGFVYFSENAANQNLYRIKVPSQSAQLISEKLYPAPASTLFSSF
jgi:hypothetical protein